jgi:HAD superfamily hydrolase (TIGR01509 family)
MKNSGKEEEFVELKNKVISIVERYEAEAARKTHLLPHILKTLKTLREMKLKMAICTTNGEKSTSHILKRLRIAHFFEAVVTREAVSAVKPDPAHLEAALKALNIKPEEAIVVGDSTRDMECAQKLNILAVGVTTGISSPEALTNAGADYLASSSADIPTLIQQLNR